MNIYMKLKGCPNFFRCGVCGIEVYFLNNESILKFLYNEMVES